MQQINIILTSVCYHKVIVFINNSNSKILYVLLQSLLIILVDPNLVHTLFGNNFFDPNYGAHPWK